MPLRLLLTFLRDDAFALVPFELEFCKQRCHCVHCFVTLNLFLIMVLLSSLLHLRFSVSSDAFASIAHATLLYYLVMVILSSLLHMLLRELFCELPYVLVWTDSKLTNIRGLRTPNIRGLRLRSVAFQKRNNRKQWQKTGNNRRQRETTGDNGRPWEAIGDHGRQRETTDFQPAIIQACVCMPACLHVCMPGGLRACMIA